MTKANLESGLSYSQARPVFVRQTGRVDLIQIGAGGTGSWLFPQVVRIARQVEARGQAVSLTLIDPDTVSEANILRQNFAACEIGLPKAQTLALRYAAAWGREITALTAPFESNRLLNDRGLWGNDRLVVVIACVDNASARQEISRLLPQNDRFSGQLPNFWVLETGNYPEGGQVLLGSTSSRELLQTAFAKPGICSWLPSPYLQHPELLEPRPEELAATTLDCAELALANAQSLTINLAIAAQAADMLLRLLLGGLKRFATYLYLPTGTTYSRYTSPTELQEFLA